MAKIDLTGLFIAASVHSAEGKKELVDTCGFQLISVPGVEGETMALAIVADGTGGQSVGKQTIHEAFRVVRDYLLNFSPPNVPEAITAAILSINQSVLEQNGEQEPSANSRPNVIVAALTADQLHVVSSGDGRAYLLRRGALRRLIATSIVASSRSYLHPTETLEPGDVLMLSTGRVGDLAGDQVVEKTLTTIPPQTATSRLVKLALDRGGGHDLAVMLVDSRRKATPVAVKPNLQYLSSSRILIPLAVLANVIALVFLGILLLRYPSAPGPILPQQTLEIMAPPALEKPANSVSQTQVAAGSKAGPLPGVAFTPISGENWMPPRPIVLRLPFDNEVFDGPSSKIVLSWDSLGELPPDIYYVVTMKKYSGDQLVLQFDYWTKNSNVQLDQSLYDVYSSADRRFEWSVVTERLTGLSPDGTKQGVVIGQPSPVRVFLWADATPTPQPYGSFLFGDKVPAVNGRDGNG